MEFDISGVLISPILASCALFVNQIALNTVALPSLSFSIPLFFLIIQKFKFLFLVYLMFIVNSNCGDCGLLVRSRSSVAKSPVNSAAEAYQEIGKELNPKNFAVCCTINLALFVRVAQQGSPCHISTIQRDASCGDN